MTDIRKLAERREKLHEEHASSRPLSRDYEYIGLKGEELLAAILGTDIDEEDRPAGDNGVDARKSGYTYDIKTARKPYNLLVEQGKCNADIYILARYDDTTDSATPIGWELGLIIKDTIPRDVGGYGIISHAIPADELRPMDTLPK